MLPHARPLNYLTGELKPIDAQFGGDWQRVELDMGCGKGRFSLALAERNPETLVLAADIKKGRLETIMNKAALADIQNIETLRSLGWDLAGFQIPDNCLDRIHVLNPDPWPKSRHRGNRMLTSEFIGRLSRCLKKGGILHLSTDDVPYLEWMKTIMSQLTIFEESPEGIADMTDVKTEFETNYINREEKHTTHLSYRLLA
jgi:tRNA (guanine-N7-)-methyltransferase